MFIIKSCPTVFLIEFSTHRIISIPLIKGVSTNSQSTTEYIYLFSCTNCKPVSKKILLSGRYQIKCTRRQFKSKQIDCDSLRNAIIYKIKLKVNTCFRLSNINDADAFYIINKERKSGNLKNKTGQEKLKKVTLLK